MFTMNVMECVLIDHQVKSHVCTDSTVCVLVKLKRTKLTVLMIPQNAHG